MACPPALTAVLSATMAAALAVAAPAAAGPRNVIIFVADGLRAHMVTPQTAPALAEVRDRGVDLQNSHSIYPTITTPNASVIATGHLLGDTGDFGNSLYVGKPFEPPYAGPAAALEDDAMLGLMNSRFGGDYLGHTTLLEAARAKGYATAAIGKHGPTAIQDVTARDGRASIVIDDATGYADDGGLPLAPEVAAAIKAAGLPVQAPDRGLNTWGGAYNMPGVQVANVEQQRWFADVAAKVLLPRFKAQGKPFALVFWSRDPDGTQHNQGDSLNALTPGINGPTTLAAIRNASDDLAELRRAVKDLGLEGDTDVVVIADHGFSVMSRQSQTSYAATLRYPDVVPGLLPQGFLGIDLAHALGLALHDAVGAPLDPATGFYPKRAALLGPDGANPDVVVVANGGTSLIYLPTAAGRALAPRVVEALTAQDYTGAIFVRDALGSIPGTLPTSAIGLAGDARTPAPDVVVSYRSFSTGCDDPEVCGAEVADSDQQQGQGIHGAFSRADTHNFMAAIGPDFRQGFVDPAPVSNADVAPTLAHVMGLDLDAGGHTGRVLHEILRDGPPPPPSQPLVSRSQPAANGFVTVLDAQGADGKTYLDAAGMPGRTLGLRP